MALTYETTAWNAVAAGEVFQIPSGDTLYVKGTPGSGVPGLGILGTRKGELPFPPIDNNTLVIVYENSTLIP